MVASEVAPFAKTGGLADVVGSLPAALRSCGEEVAVVIPRYGSIDLKTARRVWDHLPVYFGADSYPVSIYQAPAEYPVYLVDCPPLYDRKGLYGESGLDYPDNHIRFAVFCRGRAGRGPQPVSHRHFSLPRLADRAGAGLPAHHARHRPHLSGLPHALHDSQPGLPGTVPENGAGGGRRSIPPSIVRTAWSSSVGSATSRPGSSSPTL